MDESMVLAWIKKDQEHAASVVSGLLGEDSDLKDLYYEIERFKAEEQAD